MNPDDEFLRNAADAQRWAECSRSPEVKAGWLRVAATGSVSCSSMHCLPRLKMSQPR
jgi:hypothetical protein